MYFLLHLNILTVFFNELLQNSSISCTLCPYQLDLHLLLHLDVKYLLFPLEDALVNAEGPLPVRYAVITDFLLDHALNYYEKLQGLVLVLVHSAIGFDVHEV